MKTRFVAERLDEKSARGFETERGEKRLRQDCDASWVKQRSQSGVDGFAKRRRALLVALQTY